MKFSEVRKMFVPLAVAAVLGAVAAATGETSPLYLALVQLAVAYGVYKIPNAE